MNEAKELLSKLLIAFQNKTVWQDHDYCAGIADECKKYLLKPEPEPLGYMRDDGNGWFEFSSHDDEAAFPVYRELPARKPLSDDFIENQFNVYAEKFDQYSNEWQDKGIDEVFKAGFRCAEKITT